MYQNSRNLSLYPSRYWGGCVGHCGQLNKFEGIFIENKINIAVFGPNKAYLCYCFIIGISRSLSVTI